MSVSKGGTSARPGTIDVRTSRARYETDRLILAPGSWAPELFKIDWLPLEVEPQQLHWFDPGGGPAPFMPDRFPIYIWDLGDGIQFYGFPADDDGRVKVAFFRSKVKGEAAIRDALAPCIPALATGALVETVSCKYTLTPDHHFVIGHHPDFANVVIASPCSGHGYKFASVIGEILADLADRRRDPPPDRVIRAVAFPGKLTCPGGAMKLVGFALADRRSAFRRSPLAQHDTRRRRKARHGEFRNLVPAGHARRLQSRHGAAAFVRVRPRDRHVQQGARQPIRIARSRTGASR